MELLGERVLFKRIDGLVYAIEDRCAHRGVAVLGASRMLLRQHGDLLVPRLHLRSCRDGKLVGYRHRSGEPADRQGRASRPIAIEERQKSVVFVFIGDDDPPPLVEDVQPGFLDDDLYIAPSGDRGVVKSNWRLAAENGVDASHIYIHRNSRLLNAARRAVPLSSYFVGREDMVVESPGGPKGVVKGAGRKISVWETEIEGNRIASQYRREENPAGSAITDTSLWMPCGLKVDPFPIADFVHFEWYVPIDEHSHYYIVTWGKRVADEAGRERFAREVETVWREMVVDGFNDEDVFAREAMERFYAEEDGWNRERLFRPDVIITEWRKLASRCNRGIQRRAHTRPGARP